MKIRISIITLAAILVVSSCGQEKHEPALLDSMPAGYDIYLTFSPSEIDADAILSNLEEVLSQVHQQMPWPVAGILGFDPFDWDAWVETFALDPDGEIGMVIALADDEPELIAFFLPSTDADKVRGFVDDLIAQAPDMDAFTLITESESTVILAIAPEQSILDEFDTSLGEPIETDENYTVLREQSAPGTPGMEVFIDAAVLSDSELEGMLVTCFPVESRLTAQFIAQMCDVEGLEYAAVVSQESSGNVMKIPADATGAMHVSVDMAVVKEMVITSLPPDAQMVAAMLGFESVNDILDIFSGDAWFALETDGDSYSGMIAYGLSDTGALLELLESLTGLMGMSGEEYNSFQFQGNTCLSVDVGNLAGIETIEIGVVDDVFVVAGGYTLQDVADGITFDDYLERTGLNITDEGGFALAADIGVIAEAYDLNSETDNFVDLEEFGFISMSGTSNGDIFQFQVSIDFGTANPFAVMTDVVMMMAYPRFSDVNAVPTQIDLTPVETDSLSEPMDQG